METYIPSSDLDESQATQLIQNVLGASDPSARQDGTTRWNKPEDSVLNDSSADSSSMGRSTSTQYHLHGLGQTQSQVDDENAANGGSQKENINGVGRSQFASGWPISSLDHPTKNTRTKGRHHEQQNQPHSRIKEKPRLKSDDSSSKGPPVHYNTSMKSNYRDAVPSSRPRSPSLSSQDSFAEDAEDPEKNLLSSAKQFQAPLSELARPPSFGQRTSEDSNGNSFAVPYPPLTRSSHASYIPSQAKLSSGVYTRNHHLVGRKDTTVADEEPDSQNSNISVSSSAPGSSLYEQDAEPPADDNQATQPTTQSEEAEKSDGPDPAWLLAAAKISGTVIADNDPASVSGTKCDEARSSTSGTRSLLPLIHPKNRWRKQRYQNIITEAQSSRSNDHEDNSAAVQGSFAIQETQPRHENETDDYSQTPSLPSVFPSPVHREKQRPSSSKDVMDIVPDSEPSREEPQSFVLSSTVVVGDKATHQHRFPRTKGQQKNATPAKRAYEQNDDSGDDDIPLAKLPERRGREREQTCKPFANAPRSVARASSRVQESIEVPSSVPEQDAPVTRPRPPRSARTDVKAMKNERPVSNRRVLRRIDEEEVEESRSESENGVQVEKPQYRERDEMVDEDYEDDAQASSRKRKRSAASTKTPVTRRKGPVTRGTKAASVTTRTAPTKQIKRLSKTASVVKMTNMAATRVFALWRQDGHFYSGTVHMFQPDNRFLVKFDDGTEAVVSIEQMRLCELHVGDDILPINRTRSSRILDLSKLEDNIVIVDLDGDPEEVEIRNIRIASRTIKSAWKDRLPTVEGVIPTVPPIKTESPAPSGVSLASAQSNKNVQKKFLLKTGLVVSLSAGSGNSEKKKESLISMIRDSGGVVLDDWSTVVRMEGKHTLNNNRWVFNKDEVQWTGKEDIERVFLLADDSSQKPKFLMAIGLGIPCLSLGWLHDSVSGGEEREWAAYMLPQGYSDKLSARISQQVDVDWGNSVHQLTDIMGNVVPAKVFSNKSILCIGPDMVPQPKGKRVTGTDEKTQEASNAVGRIIMCMGARRVEAVTEPRYASAHASDYDYVVIKDSCASSIEGTVVTWSWVKDCLIASRRLPLEDEITSQEAY